MTSIRRKLFLQIGSIILLFILLLYLANTFLLESLYVQGAKNRLTETYEKLNAMEVEELSPDTLYQMLLDSRTFIEMAIIDEVNGEIYLPANPSLSNDANKAIGRGFKTPPPNQMTLISTEILNDQINLIKLTDHKIETDFYMLQGYLDNGLRIEMRIPLASIRQNVLFFNQFILGAGILIMIAAFIAANLISKHFTKPIQNMTKVTEHLKKMDFSETCEVTTNDEIGRLAEYINEMSYALETNMNALETSNLQLSEEIKEKTRIDEQRQALLNNVSHELKTPLAIIQGYSEGLKLNLTRNTDKAEFYSDVIVDEAKKMDMLVSQLLDINHIQFGDFPLHKEVLNAKDFINNILMKYRPMMEEDGIQFDLISGLINDSNDLLVHIDALRTEQIITNLLNNAMAYVDDRHTVTLTSELMDSQGQVIPAVSLADTSDPHSVYVSPAHMRLTISNSFPQIPAPELNNWWNSFYKADKARTRENGGYGLGLSIIKAIQEADDNAYGVYWSDGLIHFYIDFDVSDDSI